MVIVLVVVKWLLWRLWLFGCRCWLEMLLLVLNRVTNIGLANWHAKKKNNVKLPEIYSFIVFILAIHSIWFSSETADPVRTLRLCSAPSSDNNYKLIKHYHCRHSRSMSKSFYHPLKGINLETFLLCDSFDFLSSLLRNSKLTTETGKGVTFPQQQQKTLGKNTKCKNCQI